MRDEASYANICLPIIPLSRMQRTFKLASEFPAVIPCSFSQKSLQSADSIIQNVGFNCRPNYLGTCSVLTKIDLFIVLRKRGENMTFACYGSPSVTLALLYKITSFRHQKMTLVQNNCSFG